MDENKNNEKDAIPPTYFSKIKIEQKPLNIIYKYMVIFYYPHTRMFAKRVFIFGSCQYEIKKKKSISWHT